MSGKERIVAQLEGLVDAILAGAEIKSSEFKRGRDGGYYFNISIEQNEDVLERAALIKKARTGKLLE